MAVRRSSDHRAASPRRSHQEAARAARTWAAVAWPVRCGCTVRGVAACVAIAAMAWPGMTAMCAAPGPGRPGRAASKPRCSPAWVSSMAAPMPGSERSRPPSTQPSANTARKPAVSAHDGGRAPMASPCPAAASSTHTAAKTAARRPLTAGDALMVVMVRDPPTAGWYVRRGCPVQRGRGGFPSPRSGPWRAGRVAGDAMGGRSGTPPAPVSATPCSSSPRPAA